MRCNDGHLTPGKRGSNNRGNDVYMYENELQHHLDLLEKELETLAHLEWERGGGGTTPSSAGGVNDSDEKSRLLKENRKMRKILQRMERRERVLAQDPQVLEIRNKVAAVRKEVGEVEKEVQTLDLVRLLWKKGFDKVHAKERSVTAIRGRQYEEQQELRDTLRDITEELQNLEKRNVQLHMRFAALQKQVSLRVSEKEASALIAKRRAQEKTIEALRKQLADLKSLRTAKLNNFQSLEFKEGRAKAKLEKDIADFKEILLQRTKELEQMSHVSNRHHR